MYISCTRGSFFGPIQSGSFYSCLPSLFVMSSKRGACGVPTHRRIEAPNPADFARAKNSRTKIRTSLHGCRFWIEPENKSPCVKKLQNLYEARCAEWSLEWSLKDWKSCVKNELLLNWNAHTHGGKRRRGPVLHTALACGSAQHKEDEGNAQQMKIEADDLRVKEENAVENVLACGGAGDAGASS